MGWPRSRSVNASSTSRWWLSAGSVVAALMLIAVVIVWGVVLQREPPSGHYSTTTPSATPRPGITARSAIMSSGSLRTEMKVELKHALPAITLSVPATGPALTGASFDPVIRDLHVFVGGKPIAGLPSRLFSGGDARVFLPPGTRAVDLVYEAGGVVARSRPAAPGRALVLATPLRMSAQATLRSTVVLQGDQILNLGCWSTESPPVACGEVSGDSWEVQTPAASGGVAIVAQINLPAHNPR